MVWQNLKTPLDAVDDAARGMRIFRVADADGMVGCHLVRQTVFMGEQGVTAAEEWDGLDDQCLHFLAEDEAGPAGTARVLPLADGVAKIQRVAVLSSHRGTGLGMQLMQAVLEDLTAEGFKTAALDGQTYAIPFYERLGFAAEGPEFEDAGIMHRYMTRPL